jgi:glycosyltransferase involved in cell wall biosynthesis
MRILWVKAGKLLPVDTGGKIRSYNIARVLARDHQVTLLSYYSGKRDLEYHATLLKEFPRAEIIHTATSESSSLERGIDYIRHFARPEPYAVSKFTNALIQRTISSWLSCADRYDVAVCDFLSASLNFPGESKTPTVLFQHNVESSLWKRMAKTESNPIFKLLFAAESAKMTRYERSALRKFSHVIAVSEHDRRQMLELDRSVPITVVPTGVNTKEFGIATPSSANPPRVVFVGSMDWEPNIDAVAYFCQQIWPRILAGYPNVIFQIVGRSPHRKVRRLASASVHVTGTVSSVADYLRDATVVVIPLRIGGGTRLKIFEAMALGKALVSTSVGAEGLDIQNGRDLILADEAAKFAESVLLLLRDEELRHKYEKAAVQLASQYDWSRIAVQFANVLSSAIKKGAFPEQERTRNTVSALS